MNYQHPIIINNFDIYDIFHNHNNELVIIAPYIPIPYNIKYISNDNNILTFYLYMCPHRHTYIYKLNIEYNKNIKIKINDCIIETLVNKYPDFKDEIIFSTIVKDEDNFIIPWIEFHLKLGITRFIIYDNSTNFTLSNILNDYINKNIVLLIKWTYPYYIKISGFSGQTTQQNHSIYAFRNSKYIGLFDIDEYINIQNISNIHHFFENLIIIGNIDVNKIGSFRLLNKFFYNPNNLPVNNNNFLKIFNCDNITKLGHEKNFVIPKNVFTFSVHMVTSGKPMCTINEKYIYFNHYLYLNKVDRGIKQTEFIDDTILQHLI
jgi:hypothetical protein